MKNKLKTIVKYNHIVYYVYSRVMSVLLRFLGLFIKQQNNMMLFVVYGGKRYDDSPKFVYEYLKKQPEFKNFKMYWAFINPETIESPIADSYKIKIDTLKYFLIALKAKYWITNSSCSRGLSFMKPNAINIQFQHGMTGIKKTGTDLETKGKSFQGIRQEVFNYIVIEGTKEESIIRRSWGITEKSTILNVGLPRNDELANINLKKIEQIKKDLKIPYDKKVILYAPTYREYNKDSEYRSFLKPPLNFDKWENILGKEYVLLITAHYEVAELLDIPSNSNFIINAFKYPRINDLLMISDLLISDYSSVIFDYSILGRPIFSYAYDFETYNKIRGIYPGYQSIFMDGINKTEDDLISAILKMDLKKESAYTKEYIRNKYISNYGDATIKAVNTIFYGKELN